MVEFTDEEIDEILARRKKDEEGGNLDPPNPDFVAKMQDQAETSAAIARREERAGPTDGQEPPQGFHGTQRA